MSNEDHLGGPTFLSPLFPFPLIDHLLTLLDERGSGSELVGKIYVRDIVVEACMEVCGLETPNEE